MTTNPSLALFLIAVFAIPAGAEDPEPQPAQKRSKPAVYDEQADAGKQIASALAVAARDHKRVLIQWGVNWCGWCVKLHDTMTREKALGLGRYGLTRELVCDATKDLTDGDGAGGAQLRSPGPG